MSRQCPLHGHPARRSLASIGETRVAMHPVRKTKPTAALLHSAEPATFSFQKKAVNDFRIAEAARHAEQAENIEPIPTPTSSSLPARLISSISSPSFSSSPSSLLLLSFVVRI
ncbi:uncharacterized protein F5147DRAFT_837451, partial [Suillus discolor]